MYPQDGKDAEALRIAADLAMYAEKEASRKREPEARREGLQEGLPRPLRS
jgi:GGDEF domain-containing protein